jgi:hypothetical protein
VACRPSLETANIGAAPTAVGALTVLAFDSWMDG